MNLAKIVSSQSRAVVVLVILLCAGGIYSALVLPTAIFPQTDFPRVVIIVDNGDVPAEQMLVSVTRPIEEAMNGIPGIENIKSTTSRGSAEVNLYFNWSVDVLESLQLVQARISQLNLPPTAQFRRIDRLTFAVFPVSGYSLTSDKRDLTTLREIASYTIRQRLARLPGVANVAVAGGDVREYHITVDPQKLHAHNLSIQQVADAVKNSNVLASPGLMEENHQLELVLISQKATKPEQLKDIVVGVVNNLPIKVFEVAAVSEGVEPNYTIVTADGKRAVLINILRQPNANTVAVTAEVKTELAAIQKELPADIKIAPFYDQSILVSDSINSARDAIIIGLILSVIILYAFLRNIGTTVVAILIIPVTVLATFLAMYLVGLSFNLMTLGGVAAAIGLVIDTAIVVVENIYTHLLHGEARLKAIQNAISEITVPLIGSTLTPVVVFLPLALITGVTGSFFRSLALTMVVALLMSLVLALTFTPVLAEKFIKVKRGKKSEMEDENGRFLSAIIGVYEKILKLALEFRWIVLIISALILVGSYFLYQNLGSEFLPSFDEGAFVLDYTAPPGTSLEETNRILQHVEQLIRETPEIESYSRRTGLQLGLSITEPNTGDFLVKLKEKRSRSTEQVTDELRGKIESSEPTLRVEFAGILSDLIGDLTSSPSPIQIRLFSEDKAALQQTAKEVEQSIQKVNGVVDTFDGIVVSGAAVTFQIDAEAAARFGVSPTDIINSVTTAMLGDISTSILEKSRLIAVRVKYPNSVKDSLETLKKLPIRSASGQLFTLEQVATVEYDKGQTEIDRYDLRQSIAVTARLSGSDLGTAISQIKTQLAKDVKFPAGMTVEYGGLYKEQQKSFSELAFALVLAIALVFLTLLIEFRSFAHPIAILAGAILALGGVLLGLFVTGMTLNVVSFMGMIMIVGIVAKNGILMLDAVEENIEETGDLQEALLKSGRRRFRPVLMTSLAAILGMAPLAFAIGAGSQLLQPLAIAVVSGLVFALILSLVVTPTVFALITKKTEKTSASKMK